MSKRKILIQFDPDSHASTFDSIVAIDAGVDELLTQPASEPVQMEGLVHGAIFTRGPDELKSTAIFIGGSNVAKSEALALAAQKSFFGPMRVSMMCDPNGSNTTAAAAVLCAQKHVELVGSTITVLAGTGPVGQRIARIIGSIAGNPDQETKIRICSRARSRAADVCRQLEAKLAAVSNGADQATGGIHFEPFETATDDDALAAATGVDVVFAAGAAGANLLEAGWEKSQTAPRVAIDLNAVPPAGIAGIDVMNAAVTVGSTITYGAIGVGGLKMKIHKRSLQRLFESNDQVLDAEEIYAIGRELG